MSFVSLNTLLFISLVIAINSLLPKTKRYYWLLASSLSFLFLLSWQSALVLITLSSFNFLVGKKVLSSPNLYYLGVFSNIMAIIGFNYIGYYNKNLALNFKVIHFSINEFILAIGLSFYSIQHIAYLIDLKKSKITAETNYLKFLFCSSFFPKLISGPVTKHEEMLMFTENNELSRSYFFTGFNRFLLG